MKPTTKLLPILVLAGLSSTPAQAQWSTDNLSVARRLAAAVSAGDLAFFAGGQAGQASLEAVDIYDSTSGLWTTDTLSSPRNLVMATRIGNYVLFAGGALDSTTQTDAVDIFDLTSGTWLPNTIQLTLARFGGAATTVGGKAIFAGGVTGSYMSPVVSDVVDIYDSALGTPDNQAAWYTGAPLSAARGGLSALTVGDLALFAGGTDGVTVVYDTVDIYNSTTDVWTTTNLSEARAFMGVTTVGTRAYFGGGTLDSVGSVTGAVDIYDSATNTWTQDALPVARGGLSAVALGNTVLFAGGYTSGFVVSKVVDTLNVGTGHWSSSQPLSVARADMGATTVAGKALFAGGTAGPGQPKDEVDIYEPVGTNYCVAEDNSTGCAGTISGVGNASMGENNLVLSTHCVPNGVYIYFYGTTQQQVPFGNGVLCLGGSIVRILPPGIASGGLAQSLINLPSAGITTPGLRNFQCWFRDVQAGGAGFDTSDALEITFVP